MFNWFKKEEKSLADRFFEAQEKREKEEPKEEPERTYLSIGPTRKNRVSLRISYGEVTMDAIGIDSLIKTLEASKSWIIEKEENETE